MRLAAAFVAALGVLAACGGTQAAAAPVKPAPPAVAKRVIVEDSSADDNEDGVTMKFAHGHMEPAAVSAGIDPHSDELTACYITRLKRRRWLGGHVQLHWDIRADGTVSSVKLAESDLGDHDIERCLVEVARGATFAKPVGGDADFMLPLEFSAKGALQIWDEDRSLRAIGGQTVKLDACDAKAAANKEPRPSDVVVTLYVGPRGAAQSVGFSSSATEIGPKWAECASKAALGWRLPDPKGGVAKLAIRYRSKS